MHTADLDIPTSKNKERSLSRTATHTLTSDSRETFHMFLSHPRLNACTPFAGNGCNQLQRLTASESHDCQSHLICETEVEIQVAIAMPITFPFKMVARIQGKILVFLLRVSLISLKYQKNQGSTPSLQPSRSGSWHVYSLNAGKENVSMPFFKQHHILTEEVGQGQPGYRCSGHGVPPGTVSWSLRQAHLLNLSLKVSHPRHRY